MPDIVVFIILAIALFMIYFKFSHIFSKSVGKEREKIESIERYTEILYLINNDDIPKIGFITQYPSRKQSFKEIVESATQLCVKGNAASPWEVSSNYLDRIELKVTEYNTSQRAQLYVIAKAIIATLKSSARASGLKEHSILFLDSVDSEIFINKR